MNYYLNKLKIPISILAIIILLILFIIIFLRILNFIDKYFQKFRSITDKIETIGFILCIFPIIFITILINDCLIDGRIRDIYFTEKNNQIHLTVWFTREDTPAGVATVYSHRLKSYDLIKGKQKGSLDLEWRYFHNGYCFFGPFENSKVWCYSYRHRNSIKIVDLYGPKLIADQKKILKLNPQLGKIIEIVPWDPKYQYNPLTNELYIACADGKIFGVDPQINIHPYKENEINTNIKKEKISKTPDSLFYYIDEKTKMLYNIDLTRAFKKGFKPLGVLPFNDDIYIFADKKGYSLTALRIDSNTGKIIDKINYF